MNAEDVLHLARENVPDDDGEVDAAGHQRALIVARRHLMRVQQTRDLVPVTSEGAVRRPAYRQRDAPTLQSCVTVLKKENINKKILVNVSMLLWVCSGIKIIILKETLLQILPLLIIIIIIKKYILYIDYILQIFIIIRS